MPPKVKFTKDDIVSAALELAREQGLSAVTARNVGKAMGATTKVIFTNFENMQALHDVVTESALEIYNSRIEKALERRDIPPYKASGIAYIQFARDEKELFKILFMRDRSNEKIEDEREKVRPIIEIIKKNTGLSEERAYELHLELWLCVHGIAATIVTSYVDWDDDFIDRMLTDMYLGLKMRFLSEG